MQDPMSPGQDGLRAINGDGSKSRQSIAKPADGGLVELPTRSKATIFAEDVRGSGIPATRLDIGANSMSLNYDLRLHSGDQTTGLRGGDFFHPPRVSRPLLMGTELSLLRQCMLRKRQTLSRLLMDSQSKMPSSFFCFLKHLRWICET